MLFYKLMIDGPFSLPAIEMQLTDSQVERYIEQVLIPVLGYLAHQPDLLDESKVGEIFRVERRLVTPTGALASLAISAEVMPGYDPDDVEAPGDWYCDIEVVSEETQPDMLDDMVLTAEAYIRDEELKSGTDPDIVEAVVEEALDNDQGLLRAWRVRRYQFTTDRSCDPGRQDVSHELRDEDDDVIWSDYKMGEKMPEADEDDLDPTTLIIRELGYSAASLTNIHLIEVAAALQKLGVPHELLDFDVT